MFMTIISYFIAGFVGFGLVSSIGFLGVWVAKGFINEFNIRVESFARNDHRSQWECINTMAFGRRIKGFCLGRKYYILSWR